MKTLEDYQDLYSKTEVLLLADVSEQLKNIYNLDPCHYISSPKLSWGAMVKMREVKLYVTADIDLYQVIEKDMKGRKHYMAQNYSKENNQYVESYDKDKIFAYIIYIDANNLYGLEMIQDFPTYGF